MSFSTLRNAFELVSDPSGIKPTDALVLLMSLTGAGQTTFLLNAIHASPLRGNDGLRSQTQVVQAVRLVIQNDDVVVVHTPGFDNTDLTDAQLVQMLSKWLEHAARIGVTKQKLLFFHRATDNRTNSDALTLLAKIIGPKFAQHTTFVITDVDSQDSDAQVEIDLLDVLRQRLSLHDARSQRFDHTHDDTALEILQTALFTLTEDNHARPLLQEQLDDGLHPSLTHAGRFLLDNNSRSTLLSEMRLARIAAEEEGDRLLANSHMKEYQRKKRQVIRRWDRMARVPIGWRLRVWFRRTYAFLVDGQVLL